MLIERDGSMKVEGVVFDLDATLINLGGFVDWRKALIMAKEAYLACGCPEEMINRLGEKGLFNMLNMVREENALIMDASEVERIQKKVYGTIESCEWEGTSNCHLLPGCSSTLNWLKDQGIRMGVATSNSQDVTEWILESKNIRDYFSSVVGRRPELRMKPYPDQILKCLEEMRVEPNRSVVVGDSVKDVLDATSANIIAIAIPSYFTRRQALEDAGADYMIENFKDLPKILLSL
jgi:phosphoglycolate phosphatase-like HAD superfamily hydrolase